MWSDEIDNKMKKAAEGYQPAYDDKAWDQMEVLLNKHLPLQRKRRRFILLLLPLLLVGTGLFFMLQKPGRKGIGEEKNTVIGSESVDRKPAPETGITIPSKATISKQAAIPQQRETITAGPGENKSTAIKLQNFSVGEKGEIVKSKKVKQLSEGKVSMDTKLRRNIQDEEKNLSVRHTGENIPALAIPADNPNNIIMPVSGDKPVSEIQKNLSAEEKKLTDSSDTNETKPEIKLQRQKNSANGKLSLYLSAGPDISSVGMDNPGKWTLQYGAGLSYAFSNRWSIRTGFFAGSKIYSADSTEYHSSYYPPKLERIDANCLVYEIPVNLIYNFPTVKNHHWFIAGGLSSYIMKEETYEYYYKNNWGQPQYYKHTYKNANSHIFSVINFSGGYQYHFTDRFSLLAEPYLKIPVSGIGSGKVKLNSGGVLFSLAFKPFLKKNQP